jgi:integrase
MQVKGMGSIRQRKGGGYAIRYYHNGVEHHESVGKLLGKPAALTTQQDALRALKHRLREIHGGRFVGPRNEKLTVGEVLDAYETARRKKRALPKIKSEMKFIRAALGAERVVDITADRIERWVKQLEDEGYADGSIDVRVKYLRAALRLAYDQERIAKVPKFPVIDVNNARQGFIEPEDFTRLHAALPDPINDGAHLAYLVGWRKEEVFGLTWRMIDRTSQAIRLLDTKTGDSRVVPMTMLDSEGRPVALDLGALIDKRWRTRALGCPYVFHAGGQRVRWVNQQWNRVCRELGFWVPDEAHPQGGRPTKIFHDFRRTAYRNLIEAGVDPFTAMDIVGHRTLSMAKRYAIRNTRAMSRALATTQAYLAQAAGPRGGGNGQNPDSQAAG